MSPDSLTEISLANAATYLAGRDRKLALILKTYGPPPMWARSPGFATLVRIILEQQVSLASAGSMFGRLKENIVPFRPERLIHVGEAHLRALGMTRQKTSYCLHLAESIVTNRLKLSGLSRMQDAEARSQLMEVKGIGSWSADIYLLMALRRPDIWPASDLALASAISRLTKLKRRPLPEALSRIAEAWRPFRSVAARMLWQYYLAQRPRSGA
jgi:DNA-3-methyladenine glycosylase II